MGIGLFLAAAAVFFRDIFHLYGVILTALSYATPIFYPITIIPAEYRWIMKFNPLLYYMETFREIVYANALPEVKSLFICIVLAFFSVIVGGYLFYKKQDKFILYV